MKPELESIQTTSIDLSRSQLQSPFALVQFLESGFNGIPAMMELIGRPGQSVRKPLSGLRRHSKPMNLDSSRQTCDDACLADLASPIELAQLPQLTSLDEFEDESSSSDCDCSGLSVTESLTPTCEENTASEAVPIQYALKTSPSAPGSSQSSVISRFWTHLPVLLIFLAFLVDMPKSSGFLAFTHPTTTLSSSSIMLSLTLCGMLLFWVAGCVMIVLIGCVMYKVACAIDGDSHGKTSKWGGIMLF